MENIMAIRNTENSYGSVSKTLHWVVSLLVVCLLTAGLIMVRMEDSATKFQIYGIHKSFGLTLLAIMVFRLFWTSTNTRPRYPASTPEWQRFAARTLHFLLYVALIMMPLTGWIMSTAADHIPSYFGLFNVPMPLIPLNKSLAGITHLSHTIIAWSLIGLIVMHIGASIKHYFIDKDGIMQRMFPGG